MSTNDLTSKYGAGKLSNADMEQLKLQNPAKYQEAMDAIDKKKTLKTYANQLYEQKEPETVMAKVDEVK